MIKIIPAIKVAIRYFLQRQPTVAANIANPSRIVATIKSGPAFVTVSVKEKKKNV